jgi:hypothetical protein
MNALLPYREKTGHALAAGKRRRDRGRPQSIPFNARAKLQASQL